MEIFNNVNSVFKMIVSEKLKYGDRAVDATVGNGNDIEFILKKVGKEGFVYGFDIQKIAIENTQKRLSKNKDLDNFKLIHDGHENIDRYVNEKIDLAVFNLGYLPKADHSLITRASSTIESIEKLKKILKEEGVIVISAYLGHEGGMDEYLKILEYTKNINQREFNVMKIEFINQVNNPPKMILIERRHIK
ncbi:methyltransferase domain-containing protein [Peptostreptococcus russellii]|uniref:tRNA (mnm(5)s(2)U34)-methyltransferase n=1 Tax=Peptostreptococcus russellii TaxID=215200 RepID=UPI001625219F|nr:class I SAM-dependent methyltransferase [Peptostreptococcus russellii]MBC2577357.1 methyltransferase domain-containing protein [Peptostreptococcus russellii]